MNKVLLKEGSRTGNVVPTRGGSLYDWQRWAPYGAIAWSLIYASLGGYWAVSRGGFPYTAEAASNAIGPVVGRFGPGAAWVIVLLAGIPAAAMGVAMLPPMLRSGVVWRGVRGGALRPLFIAAGALLAGVLLLLTTDLTLLETLGYIPFTLFRLITGGETGFFVEALTHSTAAHQLFCLIGGFIWLAATVSYARRSGDACLYCGRRDGPEGWQARDRAARWGRSAVYVAMVVPVFYALTRIVWALGIPLGMNADFFRSGQERGIWVAGLFLACFGLMGAGLMLGLVQHWGEVFPRWMIGLAGRRVPIALAVVPAAFVSVLLFVGGITIWLALAQMVPALESTGEHGTRLILAVIVQVGPTLLFPVWGVALAVATLGYYYRRRGPCKVCGRGASGEAAEPHQS